MYKFLVSFVQVETLHSCPERDALSMLLTGLKREKRVAIRNSCVIHLVAQRNEIGLFLEMISFLFLLLLLWRR